MGEWSKSNTMESFQNKYPVKNNTFFMNSEEPVTHHSMVLQCQEPGPGYCTVHHTAAHTQ